MKNTQIITAGVLATAGANVSNATRVAFDAATRKFTLEFYATLGASPEFAPGQEITLKFATSNVLLAAATMVPSIALGSETRTIKLKSDINGVTYGRSKPFVPNGQYLYVWIGSPVLNVAGTIDVWLNEDNSGAGGSTPGTPGTSAITTQGIGYDSSASFTRPNDTNAYAVGDVIADSTGAPTNLTFANIGPSAGGKVFLNVLELRAIASAIPAGLTQLRLHLFNAAPTAIADNAAFDVISADRTKYLGYIELPTPALQGSIFYACTEEMFYGIRKQTTIPAGTLYGQLQTMGAFTPVAQTAINLALRSAGL